MARAVFPGSRPRRTHDLRASASANGAQRCSRAERTQQLTHRVVAAGPGTRAKNAGLPSGARDPANGHFP